VGRSPFRAPQAAICSVAILAQATTTQALWFSKRNLPAALATWSIELASMGANNSNGVDIADSVGEDNVTGYLDKSHKMVTNSNAWTETKNFENAFNSYDCNNTYVNTHEEHIGRDQHNIGGEVFFSQFAEMVATSISSGAEAGRSKAGEKASPFAESLRGHAA
jgi:hypothetical protein